MKKDIKRKISLINTILGTWNFKRGVFPCNYIKFLLVIERERDKWDGTKTTLRIRKGCQCMLTNVCGDLLLYSGSFSIHSKDKLQTNTLFLYSLIFTLFTHYRSEYCKSLHLWSLSNIYITVQMYVSVHEGVTVTKRVSLDTLLHNINFLVRFILSWPLKTLQIVETSKHFEKKESSL